MKPRRSAVALAASLFLVLAVGAGACGDTADRTPVASIGDRVMTRSDLDRLLPFGDATVPQRVADTVANWLTVQALDLHAAAEGVSPTTDDLEQAEAAVDSTGAEGHGAVREEFIATIALSRSIGRWADAEAAERAPPGPPDYLCSNHILHETQQDAEATLERLDAGEDFAELAVEVSTGPTGPDGGDLGCGPAGGFVPAFEEAAFAAEAGNIVGPVETEFGWHVIEIESVGPATVENHPSAEIAALEARTRREATAAIIAEFETEAAAEWGPLVDVDASIGVFDPESFTIEAP